MTISTVKVTLAVEYDFFENVLDRVFCDVYNSGYPTESLEEMLHEEFNQSDNWRLNSICDMHAVNCTFEYHGKGLPDIRGLELYFNEFMVEFIEKFDLKKLDAIIERSNGARMGETRQDKGFQSIDVLSYLILRATRKNVEYQRFL